jgi:hypothetical protein
MKICWYRTECRHVRNSKTQYLSNHLLGLQKDWCNLTEDPKSDTPPAFDYFELDSSRIDTSIVRSIGTTRDINAIVVDVNGNLISASIHMELETIIKRK